MQEKEPPAQESEVFLAILDISGYTQFMVAQRLTMYQRQLKNNVFSG